VYVLESEVGCSWGSSCECGESTGARNS